MMLIVRDAQPEDAEVIVEFNSRLAFETEGKVLDRVELARGVAAVIADSAKGRYFLACSDNEIVGQVALTYEWSDWRDGWFWWLQSVYVRSDARGRSVFRTLHQHVVHVARENRVVGLRLYVERENVAGKSTYASTGMSATSYEVFEQLL